jgi:nucleotide-binding universal stress UspA family protein
MLKRILVLLGETRASVVARQCAFRLASAESAELAGIAGVDLAFIESPMAGGVGTIVYKMQVEEVLKAQAKDACARLRDVYEKECRTNNVPFEWLDFDGDPIGALQIAAESSDALVTGHDTAFRGNIRERLPDMLGKLCWMTPRSLIVCGDEDRRDGDIMIAYDGSLPAMRAVQLFMLLSLRSRHRIHVVAIGTDKAAVKRILTGALHYLRGRDCDVEVVSIATRAHPAEVLRIEVADRQVGTLVMGVYAHRGLRERLFGSSTTKLLEDPPCALFVYH